MERKFFVELTGAWGGTAMKQELNEYAREKFNKTIVTEAQFSEIADILRDRQEQLKNEHRNWKAVEIIERNAGTMSTDLGIAVRTHVVMWIHIGETTSLTACEVRNDYSQTGMSINETIEEGKA